VTARLRLSGIEVALVGGSLAVLALAPIIVGESYLSRIVTRALFLGIIAVSLTFLSGYGGMLSLGQAAIFGIAGFTMANLVDSEGGRDLTLNPWVGMIIGIVVATVIALFFGLVSSRSEGIYFLMITLAFGILTFYFFGQVNELSGFGGVNSIDLPGFLGNPRQNPNPLYYTTFVVSVVVLLLLRYVVRTPFGLALQGIRDDPTRMRALGFNVPFHRAVAFAFAGFIAAVGGILFVWWNQQISPGSMGLAAAINILIISIVGGIHRLEGAWVGAFVFVLIDNYSRQDNWLFGDFLHVAPDRFNTVIGGLFLLIILLSPGGIIGIGTSLWRRGRPGRSAGQAGPKEPPLAEQSGS
jgi:branched-chain amino acid transport system permease protein